MAGIWERNLAALRAREQGWDWLPPLPAGPPQFRRVRLRAGAYPVLQAPGEEGGWVTLHSPRRPREEALELAQAAPCGRGGDLVVLGMGLGYHLLAVLPCLGSEQRLVVVEKEPEIFLAALLSLDLTDFFKHPRTRLVVSPEAGKAVRRLQKKLFRGRGPEVVFWGHPPSLRAGRTYYREVLSGLRPALNLPVRPRGLQQERLRVLVVNPDYFLIPEVIRAFRGLGHDASLVLFDKRRDDGEVVLKRMLVQIGESPPDLVFTVNHLGFDREGVLLEALERLRIPSVSWYVDSPAIILSLYDGPRSELAYFFVWDPTYIPAVQAQGFEKVFPLPLATDPEIFTPQAARERPNGGGQVVFVGNSLIGSARKKLSRLPGGPEFQEIFQELLKASEARPFQPFPALLAEKSLEGHPLITGLDRQGRSDLEAALLWSATREYRRSCLQELAPFEPVIYGDVGWGELLAGSYRLRPEVNYYEDLPRIYGSCALNFNATSLQMKAAVNQRVFDVPASGGFLLTDFREQLGELFHLEEEVAYFREPGEISQLARYYLAHPEVRQKMAARARSRVLQEHTYRHRVAAMLDTMRRTL